MFREDHHLLLQVQQFGQRFQRYASDPELYRIQLLPQVLQESGEGIPAVGGMYRLMVRFKVPHPVSNTLIWISLLLLFIPITGNRLSLYCFFAYCIVTNWFLKTVLIPFHVLHSIVLHHPLSSLSVLIFSQPVFGRVLQLYSAALM